MRKAIPEYVVVYGWALWAYLDNSGREVFCAQHHAVVRNVHGILDVSTLGKSHEKIAFAEDVRVPYDGGTFRAPASLYREVDGRYTWFNLRQDECQPAYVSVKKSKYSHRYTPE